MKTNNPNVSIENQMSDWITIQEAIEIASQEKSKRISESDIYRHALRGNICLSIYFQSSIVLKKIEVYNGRLKFKPVGGSLLSKICLLERNSFLKGRNLTLSTEGRYIHPEQLIIDTSLIEYEYVLVQRLLSRSLKIPQPVTGANRVNYGITVTISGELFQIFEIMTWEERIQQQIKRLPEYFAPDITEQLSAYPTNKTNRRGYFPLHDLPSDACFVIRREELEKLINSPIRNRTTSHPSTRISTPLSRMFWLACKNNATISPLIRQPYKLLSIFEQWASAEGITDRLSGDTLKTALERGSPTSTSSPN